METIHDLIGPWVSAHPVIAVLGALILGFVLGAAVFRKGRKKED